MYENASEAGIQLDACMSGVFKTRHPCGCLQETKERIRRFKRIVNLYEKAAVPQLERQVKRRKNFLSGAFCMICNMAVFPT